MITLSALVLSGKAQLYGAVDLQLSQSVQSYCEFTNYRVIIRNAGTSTAPPNSSIIAYRVNGGLTKYDTLNYNIVPNRSYYHLLPKLATSNAQLVEIWSENQYDTRFSNDTISLFFYSNIAQLPYHEGFENWSTSNGNCWLGINGTSWKVGDSSHIVNRVVPAFDRTIGTSKGKFLYADTWNFQTGLFTLPSIDLSNTPNAQFSFWYQSPAFQGEVYIRVYQSLFSQHYDEDTLRGPFQYSQSNPWNQYRMDLSTYAGDTIVIRLFAKETIGPPNVTFDDFSVTSLAVGLEKYASVEPSLSVFPNPSNGQFNLLISDKRLIGERLQIFNTKGQLVKEQRISERQLQMDLEGYPKGMYFMLVGAQNKRFSEKIFIH